MHSSTVILRLLMLGEGKWENRNEISEVDEIKARLGGYSSVFRKIVKNVKLGSFDMTPEIVQ